MNGDRVTRTHLLGIVSGLLRAADLLAIALGSFFANAATGDPWDYSGSVALEIVAAMLLAAAGFSRTGAYDRETISRLTLRFARISAIWLVIVALAFMFTYFDAEIMDMDPIWASLWFLFALALMLFWRFILIYVVSRWRRELRLASLVAVVGGGRMVRRIVEQLLTEGQSDYLLIGAFSNDPKTLKPLQGKVPCGSVEQLHRLVQTNELDDVLFAFPDSEVGAFQATLSQVKESPVNIRLIPQNVDLDIHINGYSQLGALPLLHLYDKPLSGWSTVVKDLEDKILGATIMLLFAPFMLMIALLIKLDSKGPVLFRQVRYGFNNNKFVVYKFRTMKTDWDPRSAPLHAQKHDPRVTRVGRILRRTSLDELPQIFNVLEGSMSLVGPRPHAVVHTATYAEQVDGYFARHKVKPGITGWAQVNGFRGDADAPEMIRLRVKHDIEYIENWSLMFDLKIILMTPLVGFIHKNAY
ncbi:MAG: undecaprenyl-phosphate glucose phosphotransferase [Alphaproteobacteria bacterium]|nr:undecaprenyl-phosphate glucose phosphotransferase [Alphaproteobacteria bacterium]